MEIEEHQQEGIVVLCPAGRIDNDSSAAFQARLLTRITAGGPAVLLDLSGVEYISSAGLRALMVASKQSKSAGGRLAVAALRPVVKEIFAISRFSFVVPVFETTADAVASWQ